MLVLSRKVNESIKVSNDIEIVVVKVQNHKVRLGITAPPDVDIWRTELVGKTNQIPSVHNNGDETLEQ